MKFEKQILVNTIEVYETYYTGAVIKIEYYNADSGIWISVYTAMAQALAISRILKVDTDNVC